MISTRRASGFTLIELLVVISIIATLAAISAGAFFKVRVSQQEKLTSDTVAKLQKALLQQWTAVLDTAKKEPIPDTIKTHCSNDPDASMALWAYVNLRKNFPVTFAEARQSFVIPAYAGASAYPIPAQQIFLNQLPATTTLSPDEQSAVCLYISLTQINRRGMESGITDNMVTNWPTDAATASQFKVFTDTFNRPICFRRFLSANDMQSMPFTNKATGFRDPLDPLNKLAANFLQDRTNISNFLSRNPDSRNFIPSIFSYGVNKLPNFSGQTPDGDDIHGYRLNVEGRTGN